MSALLVPTRGATAVELALVVAPTKAPAVAPRALAVAPKAPTVAAVVSVTTRARDSKVQSQGAVHHVGAMKLGRGLAGLLSRKLDVAITLEMLSLAVHTPADLRDLAAVLEHFAQRVLINVKAQVTSEDGRATWGKLTRTTALEQSPAIARLELAHLEPTRTEILPIKLLSSGDLLLRLKVDDGAALLVAFTKADSLRGQARGLEELPQLVFGRFVRVANNLHSAFLRDIVRGRARCRLGRSHGGSLLLRGLGLRLFRLGLRVAAVRR
mmetsp:Transcript_20747/g.52585  ORF Transcript_20747/g.52585 Transcript_20747/m.52585 type:complete len:268 (+) Transcript_20747:1864-2667(+)